MGKYGEAAIAATALAKSKSIDVRDAWVAATKQVFPSQVASQAKGCPRGAYLGLCEAGLVEGVASGRYTRSKLNKRYAMDAIHLLRRAPSLADHPAKLWKMIGNDRKVENSQLDVVIALWKSKLIKGSE